MIYFIAMISSFLSGMGIGGGSLFILFSSLFNILNLNEIRAYNLLMFILIGLAVSLKNLKFIKENKKYYFKLIVSIIIGAIIGTQINNYINEKTIKILFYIFMLTIGAYEIIVSLKNMKKGKNICMKGD